MTSFRYYTVTKNIIIYISGLTLSSIGIAISLKSNLGVSSWDAVFAALGQLTILTLGMWSIIIQFTFWYIASSLTNHFRFTCVIPILLRGFTLDLSKYLVSHFTVEPTFAYQLFTFLIGYCLVATGIGIYVSTGFPRLPIDDLMIALSRALSWTINTSRFVIEITGFILAIILQGNIGIGTIIITFTLAPFIAKMQELLSTCKGEQQNENCIL